MPPFVKVTLVLLAIFLVFAGISIVIPYIRFADIKGKMKEAAENAMGENDQTISFELAENAMDDKLPLVGDYFYQVVDNKGEKFILTPESEEQRKEYKDGARQYFLEHIQRVSGQDYTISIEYTVELYFPFYTHSINFRHKEVQPLTR
jgi:hypothetical protein